MKNKYYEKIKCPICKNNDFKVLRKNQKPNISLKALKRFYLSSSDQTLIDQLVKCFNCNFIYLNPRVKSSIVIKSYSDNKDNEFIKHNSERYITFYKNFKKIEKFLTIKKNKSNFKILDVGSGGGTFLSAAKDLGYDARGIEPNKWLVKFVKKSLNVNIKQGTLESIKIKDKFDLISFWDVFEHLTDLNKSMKICKKLLKKNGYILINIPDHGSLFRKILRFKWPFFLNVHLYYFDSHSIKNIMKNYGLSFLKKRTHTQCLPIKYIFKRAGNYFKIFKVFEKFMPKKFNFGIWYNMGQNLYLFKND